MFILFSGAMFVINGGTYALTAPLYGVLLDKYRIPPIGINLVGAVFIVIGFTLLGPAPFIPVHTLFGLCIAALVFHGMGIGAMLVSSFAMAHREAVLNGFPDNLATYGLVSGLWTSVFALGAFIGPSLAGILMDHFGMRNATMFIVAFGLSVLLAACLFFSSRRALRRARARAGYEPIVTDEDLAASYGAIPRQDGMERRSPSLGYDSAGTSGSGSGGSGESSPHPEGGVAASRSGIIRVESGTLNGQVEMSRSRFPLSPRSPFGAGSVGMLGGVSGYGLQMTVGSGGSSLAAPISEEAEVPHQLMPDPHEDAVPGPPRRGAGVGREKRKKSSGKKRDQGK